MELQTASLATSYLNTSILEIVPQGQQLARQSKILVREGRQSAKTALMVASLKPSAHLSIIKWIVTVYRPRRMLLCIVALPVSDC